MESVDPEDRYETNGSAFQTREERIGPPLSYIAEKLRDAVEQSHSAYHGAKEHVPDNLPIPARCGPDFPYRDVFSTKNDLIIAPAGSAFRYALTAYLALNNMLNLPGGQEVYRAALNMTRDELEAWLDKIDSEGSLT